MLNRSYWEDQMYFGNPDHIVIGAGLVGMYTAYFLKKLYPTSDVLVLERGPFSEGASTKNAGFACFGSVSELLDDMETFGRDTVKEVLTMRWQGLQLSRSILGDENLNYEEGGGTEVFSPSDTDLKKKCLLNLTDINNLVREAIGMPNVFEYKDGCPAGTKGFDGYIFNRLEGSLDTAMFNNALYQRCIKNKVRFLYGYEVDKVLSGDKPSVTHKRYGSLEAGNVFITVNGFANELTQGLDIKPVRNQVLVTDIIEGLRLKGCYHMDKGYFYFRNVGKRILIGGGRHKLGNAEETNVLNQTNDASIMLKEILNDHLEGGIDAEIKYHWSGILGVGGDKKPIIKEMEKGIYTGVRMGGMGVAICSVVGKQLAELTQK